jgi:hypothetical protein
LKLRLLLASAALIGMSGVALADMTRIFDVSASDFTLTAGPGSDAPIDPAVIDFTLTFDRSVTVGPTTAGLKVDSFNLPFAVAFAYSGSAETLVVAAQPSLQPSGVGCALSGSGSFCLFMSDPGGPAPNTTQFQQTTADGSLWSAQIRSTHFGVGASVPEPASWTLFLTGFAALGVRLCARRRGGVSSLRLKSRRFQPTSVP